MREMTFTELAQILIDQTSGVWAGTITPKEALSARLS
jgi:hypothetical protein